MTATSRRQRPVCDRAVSSFVAAIIALLLYETAPVVGQQVSPADVVFEPSGLPDLQKGEATGAAAEPDSIRVPRPSNERPLFAHGVRASDLPARSPGSAAWWLGSTGIALALAICGAACAAGRKYWPQSSTGLVRVVGRVSLSPRQSIYLVRAGRRVILVGAGGQGAPTLLGELSESEQNDDQDEAPHPVRSSFPGLSEMQATRGGRGAVTGIDHRSGEAP
jgi:flagellar biogenesis protein FliO